MLLTFNKLMTELMDRKRGVKINLEDKMHKTKSML